MLCDGYIVLDPLPPPVTVCSEVSSSDNMAGLWSGKAIGRAKFVT